MLKISILDRKTLGEDVDLEVFNELGQITVYDTTKKEEVAHRIQDADVVIVNKIVLNEENLKLASNLKLICVAATGTNNIDLNYTRSRNIVVTNVAGYSTNSVVQHTFSLLFYLLENMNYYDNYTKIGDYCKSEIFTNLSKSFWEISGKTWGIIGLGEIGRKVANIAESFGAKVVYCSTSGRNSNSDYERKELNELLSTSDIVSIHCPLNEKTENLITLKELRFMKKSSILINVGRGRIVNEVDLAKALDDNIIGGAALDVVSVEPILDDNPLLTVKNKDKLIITPHIGWASFEARTKLINEIKLNIQSFLRKEKRNVVS